MPTAARKQRVLPFDTDAIPAVRPWLAALEDARRRTWEALENLPDAALEWSDEEGTTISSLLYHIAAIELDWLFADILNLPFPPEIEQSFSIDVRDDQGKLSAIRGETLEQHRVRLDRVRSYLISSLQEMSPPEFVRVRHLPDYDVSPLWVLHHLMQHEAEHRGQIMALRTRASL